MLKRLQISLTRGSTIPLRSQLALQLEVAVVTGQVGPGEKLPSVRELARRLKVHHNTVAAAYAELNDRGLVESRHGSGLFVSKHGSVRTPEEAHELHELIASFLEMARSRGYSTSAIREAVRIWMERQPPDHLLVVEPAPEVREILVRELAHSVGCRVESVGPEEVGNSSITTSALVVTSFYHDGLLRSILPPTVPVVTLSLNPGRSELELLKGLPVGTMLGIVSVSPILLSTVATVIASIRGDEVLVRAVPLSDEPRWRRLTRTVDAVVCDSVSKPLVERSTSRPVRLVRLVPEQTIAALRKRLGLLSDP